jgi:hypothetical protein
MTKITLNIPGHPYPISIESNTNNPIIIKEKDENGNIIKSIECTGGETLSLEGSDSRRHFNNPIKWQEYPGQQLEYRFRRCGSYINSIDNLGIRQESIVNTETKIVEYIIRLLNSEYIHGYVYRYKYNKNKNEVRLSECDFEGRNYGRLLYWVDLNPPCLYLGCLLKRNDKSHSGHISEGLGDSVAISVLAERRALIEDIRREDEYARRRN